ncbi:GNAT family N-acetyltransferase [Paenibacillus sp. N1-5-1-14]|uniref:GNAT family N-acetyltransferase n=1 Tax=Paenibacillus radicibacter TaxID=2972488 RepID=UPI002158BCB2|nr:GNAT family N-acetyltransferase [Paenibacillus radicibacter]MCR8643637.1 GNAT family N-acetyltransferase [Paenibacillus radicibacter]
MIIPWDQQYTQAVISLWNIEAVKDGYKELSVESFKHIFMLNPYFDPACTFLLLDNDQVKGFACGCTGDDLPLGDVAGYITTIVLAQDYCTDEHYTMMIQALEQRFVEKEKKQADILFFNPMRLPWYIPETPQHEHNNAPGVPITSRLYATLLHNGYVERAKQSAMYLHLDGFTIPEDVRSKESHALEAGYTAQLFDSAKHHGVHDMLDGFDNPLWRKEIGHSTETGIPTVIAAHDGKVVGFAGPVIREESGRGYFAGIGVHPEHEGHGLGTLLFFKLCEAFERVGADYMSLYTGVTNPAIRIYEKAGFKTVKHFAIMRRELVQ